MRMRMVLVGRWMVDGGLDYITLHCVILRIAKSPLLFPLLKWNETKWNGMELQMK